MKVLFCRKCGTRLPDNSMFCHRCGTKVLDVQDAVTIAENNNKRLKEAEPTAQTEAMGQTDQKSRFAGFDRCITICKQCGNFHIGRYVCDICGSEMTLAEWDLKYFSKNYREQLNLVYQIIDDYIRSHTDAGVIAKNAGKVKQFKTDFVKISYAPAEKKDKECPRCGHRCVGSSYLGEFYTCSICRARYDGNPYDYKADKALVNRMQLLERTKFALSSEQETNNTPYAGFVGASAFESTKSFPASLAAIALTSAFEVAIKHKKPEARIVDMYNTFLRTLEKHETDLVEDPTEENVNQLLEYLAMVFNVVRSGYYSGQEKAVELFEKVLIDINYQARHTFLK